MSAQNNPVNLKNREGYLYVPGGEIWYQKFFLPENEDKTPLIILHGGPGVPHNYLNNLAQLAVYSPVIFYDQLGCGKSAIPGEHPELWFLSRFIEELEILVNHLGLHEINLLGHSWGGTLAAEYAFKNPNKVKKLVLASPFLSSSLWIKDARYLLAKLPPQVSEIINKHEEQKTYDSQEYQNATLIFYKNYLCRLSEWPKNFQYILFPTSIKLYIRQCLAIVNLL